MIFMLPHEKSEGFISCNYEKRRTFINPMFLYVEQYDIKLPS